MRGNGQPRWSMVKLADIAEIQAGHAFRGAVTPDVGGQTRVIQVRDVDLDKGVRWADLESCTPPGRKAPNGLRAGDIVFQARGRKNFAIYLAEMPFERVICTQHFFVIRVRDERFSPAFVSWQLNQENAQRHLDATAIDSTSRHITLAALSNTPMVIASVEEQRQLERLVELTRREQQLYELLTKNRQQQMATIASHILDKAFDS